MGYYVDLTKANAVIPANNLDEALQRLHALNKRDELKSGGSFSTSEEVKPEHIWFSWMPWDYDKTTTSVQEILEMVGYSTDYTEVAGGLSVEGYSDKTGCEDVFIWAIADLFEPGSFMEWRGEDGEIGRWEFGGGKPMTELLAEIVWGNPETYEPTNWRETRKAWAEARETK